MEVYTWKQQREWQKKGYKTGIGWWHLTQKVIEVPAWIKVASKKA